MSTIKVNTLEEATVGGATFYTAKSWVNFDGTSTVSIRSDGNVSSITDNAEGKYTVNFSTNQSDGSYCVTTSSGQDFTANENAYNVRLTYDNLPTTSSYKLSFGVYVSSNIYKDAHIICGEVTS